MKYFFVNLIGDSITQILYRSYANTITKWLAVYACLKGGDDS